MFYLILLSHINVSTSSIHCKSDKVHGQMAIFSVCLVKMRGQAFVTLREKRNNFENYYYWNIPKNRKNSFYFIVTWIIPFIFLFFFLRLCTCLFGIHSQKSTNVNYFLYAWSLAFAASRAGQFLQIVGTHLVAWLSCRSVQSPDPQPFPLLNFHTPSQYSPCFT